MKKSLKKSKQQIKQPAIGFFQKLKSKIFSFLFSKYHFNKQEFISDDAHCELGKNSSNKYSSFKILQLKRKQTAQEQFVKALKLNQDNKLALKQLGEIYSDQNNYEKTIHFLKKATKVDQNYFEAHQKIGINYGIMGNPKQSIKFLKIEAEQNPNDSQTQYQLGQQYNMDKQIELSINHLKNSIKLDKKNKKAYYHLGQYYNKKMMEEAIEQYQQAIQIDQNYYDVLFHLALLYQELKNLDQQIKYLKKCYDLDPKNVEICYKIGKFYFENQMLNQSFKYFQKGISIYPCYIYCYLGIKYYERDLFDQAIYWFKKSLELNSSQESNNIMIKNLGQTYHINKQLDLAVQCYKKLMKSDPSGALNRLSQIGLAIRCLKKSIKKDSSEKNIFDAYYKLGLIYKYRAKNYDKAIKYFSLALKYQQTDKLNYCLYQLIGDAYKEDGQYIQAISHYKIQISLKYNLPYLYYVLGAAYRNAIYDKQYFNQQKIYTQKQLKFLSIYCFKRELKTNLAFQGFCIDMALIYQEQKKFKQVIKYLQKNTKISLYAKLKLKCSKSQI